MQIDGWTHFSVAKPELGKQCYIKALISTEGTLNENGTWGAIQTDNWQGTVYEWKYKEEIIKEEIKDENTESPGNQ